VIFIFVFPLHFATVLDAVGDYFKACHRPSLRPYCDTTWRTLWMASR